MLQCIAIALIVIFPAIATCVPGAAAAPRRAQVKTEEVDDSMNRLEEDPLKQRAAGTGGGGGGRQPRKRRTDDDEEVAARAALDAGPRARRFFCAIRLRDIRLRHAGRARRHLEHALGALRRARRDPAVGGRHRFPRAAGGAGGARRSASRTACSATRTPPRGAARGDRRAPAAAATRWRIDPAWIVFLPGVVPGLHLAARKLVPPDEHVLVPSAGLPPPQARRRARAARPTAKFRWSCERRALGLRRGRPEAARAEAEAASSCAIRRTPAARCSAAPSSSAWPS